jgi:hypothetical protein
VLAGVGGGKLNALDVDACGVAELAGTRSEVAVWT